MKNIEGKELRKIYEKIRRKKSINFDNCTVKGFSLSEYRKIYQLDDIEVIDIYIDSAMYAEFQAEEESEVCVDFSWSYIHCKDKIAGLAFDKSIFEKGIVDFSYIKIENDLSFDECEFKKGIIKIIGSTFGDQDLSFYNTKFNDANLYIHACSFGNGSLDLQYSHDLIGRVQFVYNELDKRDFKFGDMNNPKGDFIFSSLEIEDGHLDFVNSVVNKILFYDVALGIKSNFNVMEAKYITIQNCTNKDVLIIGNSGYDNIVNICLKDTINLGHIKIMNNFNKLLYKNQKKIFVAESVQEKINKDLESYYETHLDLNWELCDTSQLEKAEQMAILKENYIAVGNDKLGDEYYLLNRKYKNMGRVSEVMTQFKQLRNTEGIGLIMYLWEGIRIIIKFLVALFFSTLEWLVLDVFGGSYATKPGNYLLAVIALILMFSVIYYVPLENNRNMLNISANAMLSDKSWINAIYFSTCQFFQLDNGISLLDPVLHMIGLLQKVLGLVVLSIFTVSYTRKIIK